MANKNRGLGRGLSALMADVTQETEARGADTPTRRADTRLPIEKVQPNPDQPRRRFGETELQELADSLREKGIIQPLIVRQHPPGSDTFQIVAGERRWRAAQMAGLHEVPVIVREYDDTEVLEIAIIENIQRADLNPVEEAAGYRQLMEKFGHTQERLAEALGKSRSHIANSIRLLALPDGVREMLSDGRLTAGHARALVVAEDPMALARQVVAKGLSVRETEALVRRETKGDEKPRKTSDPRPEKDADTRALEADLSAALKMKVVVDHPPGQEAGRLTISYTSLEQLDDLCRLLGG